MENVLFNSQIELNSEMSLDRMGELLMYSFGEDDRIYSYIVYYEETEERKNYSVRYMVSQTDSNNTIDTVEAAAEILQIISDDRKERKYVIGYHQPPLEKLIALYQPLVRKLAKIQHDHWRQLEYEDLCQICNMSIVELYNKGYYIHKSLVEKTFKNAVLMELHRYSKEPVCTSLEQAFNGTDDLEKLTLSDVLADNDELLYEQDKEIYESKMWTYDEVKAIIIGLIGPRQFDQLLRGYGSKSADPTVRRTMQRVKAHFARLGITKKELNNKYYG